jgi:hypothetical protein
MAHIDFGKDTATMDKSSLGFEADIGVVSEPTTEFIDPVVERSMKRKVDLILLPMLSIMYLFK